MEADKKININEAQLRQLIREELKEYLIEEGFFGDAMQKIGGSVNLKNIFSYSTLAILLSLGPHDAPASIQQARAEIQTPEVAQQYDQIIDEQEQSLMAYGLTEEGARQIIAGVMLGAREDREKELKYDKEYQKLTDEVKEQQILDHQIEEIKKLDDKETVKAILKDRFTKKMGSQGAHTMVAANIRGGGLGAPTSAASQAIGYGQAIQQTLMQDNGSGDFVTVKGKTLEFNPIDLKSYWKDIVTDGSSVEQELKKEIGTIYIRSSEYQFAAGEVVQSNIDSQLQKENKVNKLRERLNKIRGFYV